MRRKHRAGAGCDVIVAGALCGLSACAGPSPREDPRSPTIGQHAREVVDRLSREFAAAGAREAAARTQFFESGDGGALDDARAAKRALLEDPESYGRLVRAIEDSPDPLTRRRAERLQAGFIGTSPREDSARALHGIEAECVDAVARLTLLDAAPLDDGSRETSYRAVAAACRILEPQFRALLSARNRAARDTLFRDAWEAHCFANELDPTEVQALLDALEARTRGVYSAWARSKSVELGVSRLEAWQVVDVGAGRTAEVVAAFPPSASGERVKQLFQEIGLADVFRRVRALPTRRTESERDRRPEVLVAGTSVTLAAGRGRGPDGFADLVAGGAAAVHEASARAGPNEIARPVRLFRDGVARAVATIALDEAFLRQSLGLDERVIGRLADDRSRNGVVLLRQRLFAAAFEREACRSPGRDLDELWRNLGERYFDVAPHPGLEPWPALVPIATDPFAALDDVLEQAIAAQVGSALSQETLVTNATGEWLREHVYAFGACEPWPRILERATGSPFTPVPLLRRVLGRAAGD